jgi:replicative DNA helicase
MTDKPQEVVFQYGVLGEMILKPEDTLYMWVEAGGKDEWFTDHTARKVWDSVKRLHLSDKTVDLHTVTAAVEKAHPDVDAYTMQNMVDSAPIGVRGVKHYIDEVRQNYIKQSAKFLTDGFIRGVDESEHPDKDLDKLVLELVGLNTREERKTKEKVVKTLKEQAKNARDGIKSGYMTPWPELNEKFCGLQKGLVTAFAGRAGKGKSLALMQWAHHMITEEGCRIAVCPWEDTSEMFFRRMACMMSLINSFSMDKGLITADDLERYYVALEELKKLHIYSEDQHMNIEQLAAWAISTKARHKVDVIILDAFKDILRGNDSYGVEGDDRISNMLCAMARRLNVSLLVNFHVRKGQTGNDTKRLTMDDIRGSGRLMSDARQLIILQNEIDTVGNEHFSFDIVKQNFGPSGSGVPMIRHAERGKWEVRKELLAPAQKASYEQQDY